MSEHVNLQAIARLVPKGSRVLDLGCGDGALLDYLQKHRGCSGDGLSLIHISEPTRPLYNSYAVFCLKKKT